jgi:hypothetical protein
MPAPGRWTFEMKCSFKDIRLAAIFVAIGLFFGLYAYFNIRIGTPERMGPGFFPIVLSCLLICLGLLIGAKALVSSPSPTAPVPWRGLVSIVLAPIFFGLTVRGLGFVTAVAVTVFITALASKEVGLKRAALTSGGMTLLCLVVFYFGLKIPVELFGPWLVR